ncbi:MAG: 16S rRNA processing protein RimM [Chloroflexi bacterium]|nr:16S rRNA processing protein RimM [Chloroflexota bacterium]
MSAGERLAVGLVRGLHGLRGGLRVEILTDRPEQRFRPGARLFREGRDQPLTVASAAPAEPGWLIRFEELPDRSSVEELRGTYLEVLVEPGEELPRGEYYWHEVIGATVLDVDGRVLGSVIDVYRAGGAEVFVVRGEPYGEFDLPAVRDFIRVFAPRRGEIVADVAGLELSAPEPKRPRGRRSSKAGAVTGAPTATPADAASAGTSAAAKSPDGP